MTTKKVPVLKTAPQADPQTNGADETLEVRTAFLVLINPDGRAWGTGDLDTKFTMTETNPAQLPDMHRACAEIVKDITVIETAQRTVQTLMQIQEQALRQAEQQKVLSQIGGLKVPGQ